MGRYLHGVEKRGWVTWPRLWLNPSRASEKKERAYEKGMFAKW